MTAFGSRDRPVLPRSVSQIHFKDGYRPAVDIRLAAQFLACRLLRRTISGRHSALARLFTSQLRNTEISHTGVPVICEKEIGGLDIPVDQERAVGVVESFRELNGDVQQALSYSFLTSAV